MNARKRRALNVPAALSSALAAGMAPVRKAVIGLFDLGLSRKEIVERGAAAGYNRKTLRKLISQILCGAGHRLRKPGAGRKRGFSPDALAVLPLVRSQYGDARAGKLLLAAYRAWKARAAAQTQPDQAANYCDRNKSIPNSHLLL